MPLALRHLQPPFNARTTIALYGAGAGVAETLFSPVLYAMLLLLNSGVVVMSCCTNLSAEVGPLEAYSDAYAVSMIPLLSVLNLPLVSNMDNSSMTAVNQKIWGHLWQRTSNQQSHVYLPHLFPCNPRCWVRNHHQNR